MTSTINRMISGAGIICVRVFLARNPVREGAQEPPSGKGLSVRPLGVAS